MEVAPSSSATAISPAYSPRAWMGLTSEDGTHQGQTVFETAPDSTASKELNKLVSEILEIVA